MKYIMPAILFLLSACNSPEAADIQSLKDEVKKAENDFCKMAADSGIAKAFEYFAADNAVLLRGTEIVEGKNAIIEMMAGQSSENTSLIWEPDYIDVASSGDLAYTYGKFTYSMIGPEGDTLSSNGIFHTVWRKQADGTWKYVWD